MRVASKSLATGHFIPFGLFAVIAFAVWNLSSKDLKEVLLHIIDARWFAVGGWIACAVTFYGARRVLAWRERLHDAEMSRMAAIKNQVMQNGFTLPLHTSKPSP